MQVVNNLDREKRNFKNQKLSTKYPDYNQLSNKKTIQIDSVDFEKMVTTHGGLLCPSKYCQYNA